MRADTAMLAAALVGAGLHLQGCGSSGDGSTTSTTTTTTTTFTTTTTTTTTTLPHRSPSMTKPLGSHNASKAFNEAFHGYDAGSQDTPKGVTITWLKGRDKKLNLYCPDVAGNDSDGCFDASASCRMSTIIHNHYLPVVNNKFFTFAERKVGVIFNQTLVEQYFGKCSFIYDGGSNDRYNHGCGNGAMGAYVNCNSTHSPYGNICPSTNKTCTASDPEVNAVEADKHGGHVDYNNRELFFKGPAYNVSDEQMLTHWDGTQMWETPDQLRTMVDDRFKVQQTAGCGDMCWNEVILDERLILTQLWWDPATVVAGIVYFRGDSGARSQASELQQAFQEQWGATPPLVSVDNGCNVAQASCAPFYADAGEADEVVV